MRTDMLRSAGEAIRLTAAADKAKWRTFRPNRTLSARVREAISCRIPLAWLQDVREIDDSCGWSQIHDKPLKTWGLLWRDIPPRKRIFDSESLLDGPAVALKAPQLFSLVHVM